MQTTEIVQEAIARPPLKLRWSLPAEYLPEDRSVTHKFDVARRAGFEGTELDHEHNPFGVAEIQDATAATGLVVHTIRTTANYRLPLSSADPAERRAAIRATQNALEIAHQVGADTILLIPAIVNATTSYAEAYARSHAAIKEEILPMAAALGIGIGIENVWNRFLLSPIEFARYLGEFETPLVRAHFDTGNVLFGYPQDWIRVLGQRIVKLHVKDSWIDETWRTFNVARAGSGSVDWAEVRKALTEIGFSGWATNAFPCGLFNRAVRKGTRLLRPHLRHAPGANVLMSRVQERFAEPVLRDAAHRVKRVLQEAG